MDCLESLRSEGYRRACTDMYAEKCQQIWLNLHPLTGEKLCLPVTACIPLNFMGFASTHSGEKNAKRFAQPSRVSLGIPSRVYEQDRHVASKPSVQFCRQLREKFVPRLEFPIHTLFSMTAYALHPHAVRSAGDTLWLVNFRPQTHRLPLLSHFPFCLPPFLADRFSHITCYTNTLGPTQSSRRGASSQLLVLRLTAYLVLPGGVTASDVSSRHINRGERGCAPASKLRGCSSDYSNPQVAVIVQLQ